MAASRLRETSPIAQRFKEAEQEYFRRCIVPLVAAADLAKLTFAYVNSDLGRLAVV